MIEDYIIDIWEQDFVPEGEVWFVTPPFDGRMPRLDRKIFYTPSGWIEHVLATKAKEESMAAGYDSRVYPGGYYTMGASVYDYLAPPLTESVRRDDLAFLRTTLRDIAAGKTVTPRYEDIARYRRLNLTPAHFGSKYPSTMTWDQWTKQYAGPTVNGVTLTGTEVLALHRAIANTTANLNLYSSEQRVLEKIGYR